MKARIEWAWDAVRASYWFVPLVMAVGALVLSLVTLAIDEALPDEGVRNFGWVFSGGPDGARALLATAGGSAITVAGVVFSIAIVAMALASAQYGPRLLRNFMRDVGNQVSLGSFLATFTYSLLVLRTVRGESEGLFVPNLSVTVGVVMTMGSIGVLIYFIHHAAASIQVANILAAAAEDLDHTIVHLYPSTLGFEPPTGDGESARLLPDDFERDAVPITASRTGYIDAIDTDGILGATTRHDLIVRIEVRPGSFVEPGNVLAYAWPADRVDAAITRELDHALLLGNQRTEFQDTEFAIQQIVQIGVRSLSPAINDPFTAFMCLDRLGAALSALAERPRPSRYRHDRHGALRVVADSATFEVMLSQALTEIRHAGRGNLTVTVRILETIEVVAGHARAPEDLAALRRHADRVVEGSVRTLPEPWERVVIEDRHRRALAAIDRAAA